MRTPKADLSGLVEAVRSNRAEDSLGRFMHADMWDVLAGYLVMETAGVGRTLIVQGSGDRTLYLMEAGVLRVHRGHRNSELQLAVLGPGSVVGEGAFFCPVERNATVQVTRSAVLWTLSPELFAQLSREEPQAALALSMGLGAVLSVRMLDVARRVSIT
ncbi:MAG: cyclic nucleotide-binding domain-containing protein [Burkholderiales bacterium]|nr:cyclic nucleotide-binding domain-containing protein [Burkholderiales bacterium]